MLFLKFKTIIFAEVIWYTPNRLFEIKPVDKLPSTRAHFTKIFMKQDTYSNGTLSSDYNSVALYALPTFLQRLPPLSRAHALIPQSTETSYSRFDPIILITEFNLCIRLRHQRGPPDCTLVTRDLNPSNEVCRVPRGGQDACPRQYLVDGTAIDTCDWGSAVLLGQEVDHGHGGEQLLRLRVDQRPLCSTPTRCFQEQTVHVTAIIRLVFDLVRCFVPNMEGKGDCIYREMVFTSVVLQDSR